MKDILSNPRILQLSPMAFKAYFYLRKKADENGVIEKFSIRGQAKEWDIDNNMNLTNNKITMKNILVELEEKELIQHNVAEKELIIKKLATYRKTVNVETDPKTGDGFVNIEEFKDLVDISKVDKYKLIPVKDSESFLIEFYDKNGNKLETKS